MRETVRLWFQQEVQKIGSAVHSLEGLVVRLSNAARELDAKVQEDEKKGPKR